MKKGSKKCQHCMGYTQNPIEWINGGEEQWVCEGCSETLFEES